MPDFQHFTFVVFQHIIKTSQKRLFVLKKLALNLHLQPNHISPYFLT